MGYFRPVDLSHALGFLAEGPAQVLAGGTDVYPALGEKPAPERILDVTRIAALKGIARVDGQWRIGAGVTWAELVRADLPPMFEGLKQAGRQVGSVQIQNTATLAGNVCNASPAADGVPVLLTLDASVELTSSAGRRVVPLVEFVTGPRRTVRTPGEIMTALLVPAVDGSVWSGFEKLGARAFLVISIASVAALIRWEAGQVAEARLAVGACSSVPVRLTALEAALVGLPAGALSGAVRDDHFAGLAPIDDVRATGAYRSYAVATLVLRMLDGCGTQV